MRSLSVTAIAAACALVLSAGVTARENDPTDALLSLTGEATRVTLARENDSIVCDVEVNLTFVNTGDAPVVLVRPWHESGWFGGAAIWPSAAEANTGRGLVNLYAGESNDTGEHYHDLAARLDQPTPPEDLTVAIAPGDLWAHPVIRRLVFHERPGTTYPKQATWSEVLAHGTEFWLRIAIEAWPFNVESVRPGLGQALARRWRSEGRLLLGERLRDGRDHVILSSEPMRLDLATAEGFDSVRPR